MAALHPDRRRQVTALVRAATNAKDWLWLYVADAEDAAPESAQEASILANQLEAAINAETKKEQ